MVATDIAKGGRCMRAERITIKRGKHYYIKAKYEITDALDKLGRLEDERETKPTNDRITSRLNNPFNPKEVSLEDLDLSLRTSRAIKINLGLKEITAADIICHTFDEVVQWKYLGKKSLKELREQLSIYGFSFKGEEKMNIKGLIKATKDNYLMAYIDIHRYEISREVFFTIATVLLDVLYSKCYTDKDDQALCELLAEYLEYEFRDEEEKEKEKK